MSDVVIEGEEMPGRVPPEPRRWSRGMDTSKSR